MDAKPWLRRETDEEPWRRDERHLEPRMRGLNEHHDRLMERLRYEEAVAKGKRFERQCMLDSRGRLKEVPLLPIRFWDRYDLFEHRRRIAAATSAGCDDCQYTVNPHLLPAVGSEGMGNVKKAIDVPPYQADVSLNFFREGLEKVKKNMTEEESKMVEEESKKRKIGKEEEKEEKEEEKSCKERKKKKMMVQPDVGAIRRCDQLHLSSS